MISTLRSLLRKTGFDIKRYPTKFYKGISFFLKEKEIDLIIDIGAFNGLYGNLMRELGYKGTIISFEPVSSSFRLLKENCKGDSDWICVNKALGDSEGEAIINIAKFAPSNSILAFDESGTFGDERLEMVNSEKIEITTLDKFFSENIQNKYKNILVKIDTQGFEKKVLEGGNDTIGRVAGLQIESSLIPMYEGETLFDEMLPFLKQKNFVLAGMEEVYSDKRSFRLAQIDAFFINTAQE